MSSEETRKCPACERPVLVDREHCDCGYPLLKFMECAVCRLPMPEKAQRCKHCSSYQGRIRRHFGLSATFLSLLVALISVLSSVLPRLVEYRNRHSNTVVTFLSATEEAIYIRVRNTGLSPSTLRGYRLHLANLGMDDAPLTLVRSGGPETRDFVPEEAEATIGLTTPKLHSAAARAQLEEQIAARQVTLEVEVQESDSGRQGPWPLRIVTLPADGIREFILAKVPEEQPQ
jgi:hypothetical protein